MIDYCEVWERNDSKKSLTWGRIYSGENLVKTLAKHDLLRNDLNILELGFGYNRLLRCLAGKYTFNFVGIDINKHWIDEAKKDFYGNKNFKFYAGDIRKKKVFTDLERKFDLIISLATFQHLYPDFSMVLLHLKLVLKKDGRVVIDLNLHSKGKKDYTKKYAFTRIYQPKEVKKIFKDAGFVIVKKFPMVHRRRVNKTCYVVKLKEET